MDDENLPVYKGFEMMVIRFKQDGPSYVDDAGDECTPYVFYVDGVFVDSKEDAHLLFEYLRSIVEYLSTGNLEKLDALTGKVVSVKGEYIYLVTDPEVIDGLFEMGAFSDDD